MHKRTDAEVCAPKKKLINSFLLRTKTEPILDHIQDKRNDHARGRTWNLLIRSQAPCHWATQPIMLDSLVLIDNSLLDIQLHKGSLSRQR
jgi:hypothetical protein